MDMNYFFVFEEDEDQRNGRVFRQRVNFHYPTDFSFKEAFRLSKTQVEFLLNEIGHDLQSVTQRNHALSPREKCLIALHWSGNGGQYHGIAAMHGTSKSTICRVVHEVVESINYNLLNRLVRWPEDCEGISVQFYEKGMYIPNLSNKSCFKSVGHCYHCKLKKWVKQTLKWSYIHRMLFSC